MHFDLRLQRAFGLLLILATAGWAMLLLSSGPRPMTGDGYALYVDIADSGGLQIGAKVRRSGVVLGRLVSLRAVGMAGKASEAKASEAKAGLLRLGLWIDRQQGHLIPKGAEVYVASPSPLGERHIEIGLPAAERLRGKALERAPAGYVFRGIDPPVLDRLVNVGWRSFGELLRAIKAQAPQLRTLVSAADKLQARLATLRVRPQLTALALRLEGTAQQGRELLALVEGPLARGKGTLDRAQRSLASPIKRLPAVLARAQATAARLQRLADIFGPAERKRLATALARMRAAVQRGRQLAAGVSKLVAAVKRGQGTVGRLLTDRELNSDLKESHRALTAAPWQVLKLPPARRAPRRQPPRRKQR